MRYLDLSGLIVMSRSLLPSDVIIQRLLRVNCVYTKYVQYTVHDISLLASCVDNSLSPIRVCKTFLKNLIIIYEAKNLFRIVSLDLNMHYIIFRYI